MKHPVSNLSRRNFLQVTSALGAGLILPGATYADIKEGDQRLSVEQLKKWEALAYGMFIHFGMSTYDYDEYSKGDKPATTYNPTKLDVDQWISVARDAGMKYAVLTMKHVAGFCLWPSRHTDYHVGNSSNKTNVTEKFVRACEAKGVLPGFYYCSWDNHHTMGSLTPTYTGFKEAYTSEAYREFQWKQMEELATQFGPVGEWWIDIPGVLPRDYRNDLYKYLGSKHPDSVIDMNSGISDGSEYNVAYAWPSDLINIERFLPNSTTKHVKWRTIEGKKYYLPAEVCEPIGKEWFFKDNDVLRNDEELLGMYLVTRSRGANLLLDVPPDRNGLIPADTVKALMRLRKNLDILKM
jgi:alpha-L-fucosidase